MRIPDIKPLPYPYKKSDQQHKHIELTIRKIKIVQLYINRYFEETPSTIEFLFNYKNKQGLVVKYENGKYYKAGSTQDEWIELA